MPAIQSMSTHIVTSQRLESIRLLVVAGRMADARREITAERAAMDGAGGWRPDPEGRMGRGVVKEMLNWWQNCAEPGVMP